MSSETQFPKDYLERLYAGILGKVIGVYLGHTTEGYEYKDIIEKHGEVWYYLQNCDVCEPDDDITGTYLFPRAIEDYPYDLDKLGLNIAKVWLNSLVEQESAVAWSGKGISTEHTAFLNLKDGIMPPHSGSIETNGPIVAQQVGGQIFSDMWGMLAPNNPKLAVDLVTKAVTVHHDGEALFGAQVLAAIIAMSFSRNDMRQNIIDSLEFIPKDSNIYKINSKLLEIHETVSDFREAYKYLEENHSYSHYRGKCPMEPNHAIVILALLYGENSFSKSMMIVNTLGLDTDGNSANVGVIMGVATGVRGINQDADYILPMRGLVYVPYAEGGEALTSCEALAYRAYNSAMKIAGLPQITGKKRFSFSLPYSQEGFELVHNNVNCPHMKFTENWDRDLPEIQGMEIDFKMLTNSRPIMAEALTLERYDKRDLPWYKLTASPTLYSGQVIEMEICADTKGLECALYIGTNAKEDSYVTYCSDFTPISTEGSKITYIVPYTEGRPVGKFGFIVRNSDKNSAKSGKLIVKQIDFTGTPKHDFIPGNVDILRENWWNYAWVGNLNFTDNLRQWLRHVRLAAHKDTAIVSQGTRDFRDYTAKATIMPHNFKRGGIGVRCRGLNRYIAMLLTEDKKLQLVAKLDFEEVVLCETDFAFDFDEKMLELEISIQSDNIEAKIENTVISGKNPFPLLESGAVCLLVEDGGIMATKFTIF